MIMLLDKFVLGLPSKTIRRFYINLHGTCNIAPSALLYNGLKWWAGPLKIGGGSSVGFRCHLDCRNGIEIGNNVDLASEVMIWTKHHDYNDPHFATKGGPVIIGDYAWLCARCIILPGVKIGEGAVVAAGAVVCRDVEPWTIAGGVPAKKIGVRERKDYKYVPASCNIPFL